MKKLFSLLAGILMSFSVQAQIELDGNLIAGAYDYQTWDGKYLVYQHLNQTCIFELETQKVEKISSNEPKGIRFNKGYYFKKNPSDKWQFYKFGQEEPVLDHEFEQIGYWAGGQILAYKELTGKERGYTISWISDEGQLIVEHRLEAIAKSLGVDNYLRHTLGGELASLIVSIKEPYREGLIALRNPKTRLWGFFDQSLKNIVPVKYKSVSFFSEGFAGVQNQEGMWGYVNSSGQVVIPFKFRFPVGYFSNGLAVVRSRSNLIGYIDTTGELVIPAEYIGGSPFYKGQSLVYRRDRGRTGWFFIDLEGNETEGPCQYCQFRQEKYFYSIEIDPAPYDVLVDWVDEGMGLFQFGRGFKIFNPENEILYEAQNTFFQDLVEGNFLFLELDPLSRTHMPKTGLMNLDWELLVEFKGGEF